MNDLTILYISASEMPEHWMKFQIGHLVASAAGSPIVSVTRKPLDLGTNIPDDGEKSYWNIYMQMLRAAKIATTPFVAMAEDDVLYTPEHFRDFRPRMDEVSYDRSRWSLFAWEPNPIFCLRQRISNCSLIAPRQLLIEALEERREKFPNGLENAVCGEVGRRSLEHNLGLTIRKSVEWWCKNPIVMLNHLTGTDVGDYGVNAKGRHMYKPHGQIKALEIPHFGTARKVVSHYAPNGCSHSEILVAPSQTEPAVVSPQRYAG
jgi:hypothetical protein